MNPQEQLDKNNQLIDVLLESVEAVISTGEQIPDEVANEIALLLRELTEENIQLQKQAQEAPIEAPKIPKLQESYPSSNVHSFSYDDKNGQLFVKFNGKDNRDDGPIYSYGGIAPVIFNLFKNGSIPARTNGSNRWGKWWKGKVPSIGASLYSLISSQNYPYQKIS